MATYSFLDCVATIVGPGGAISLGSGAAVAEEGITVERDEDKNTMTKGADGTPMHSLHGGRAGHAVVRLLKTSPINALLQAMYDVQTFSSALHGQNVIVVSDLVRGDVTTCAQTAFKRFSPLTYAKEGGMMEWQFDCGYVDAVLGGGAPAATVL
jgi:hypothetical protein